MANMNRMFSEHMCFHILYFWYFLRLQWVQRSAQVFSKPSPIQRISLLFKGSAWLTFAWEHILVHDNTATALNIFVIDLLYGLHLFSFIYAFIYLKVFLIMIISFSDRKWTFIGPGSDIVTTPISNRKWTFIGPGNDIMTTPISDRKWTFNSAHVLMLVVALQGEAL